MLMFAGPFFHVDVLGCSVVVTNEDEGECAGAEVHSTSYPDNRTLRSL